MSFSNFYEIYKDKPQDVLNANFLHACLHQDIPKMDYLLSSPDLSIHADIHVADDYAFITACTLNHQNVISYLIMNKNIEYTSTIENYIEEASLTHIWEMFYDRDKAASSKKNKIM